MKRIIILTIALLAAINTVSAQQNQTIWTIDFVQTKAEQQRDYLEYIRQNWAKARQALQAKGDVVLFQALSIQPAPNRDFDVLLLTEYANKTAYDNREKLFAAVFAKQPMVSVNGKSGRKMAQVKNADGAFYNSEIGSKITKIMLDTPNQNSTEATAARVPLENYIKAHATGKPEFIKQAFWSEAKITAFRDDKLVSMSVDQFAALFNGAPAPDEAARARRIESLDVTGNAAVAKIVLDYPAVKFTDYMTLLKINGEWKIVNKSFDAEPKASK